MKQKQIIAFTGDKDGVGKSTIAVLTAEWLLHLGTSVNIIDADPNQSTQTWADKCADKGRCVCDSSGSVWIVDTAGTSGSSLTRYIRNADIIVVPFKPHVSDLEVIIGWFASINVVLQERAMFIPNMLSNTCEQQEGLDTLRQIVKEERRGTVIPGLAERKAVYPPLLNGSDTNFFDSFLNRKVISETRNLFRAMFK